MSFNKISSEVIELVLDNYISSTVKAGSSVSDLGYRVYADAAGVAPVDGNGGTPGVTLSVNTTNPLSGSGDLRLVKDAVNRQGNGFSTDFTVANRHLGKVLQVTFDTELISGNYESPIITPTNGTYSITSTTCTVTAPHSFVEGQVVNVTFTSGTVPPNGTYVITSVTATTFVFTVASGSGTGNCSYTVPADLRVSIVQDPNGSPVVIEPVNTGVTLGVANQRLRHVASFQTHVSVTSYRLCVHVSNASTVAYTVDFANFKVWEPVQSIGSIITDERDYAMTSTLLGFGTVSNIVYKWIRYGNRIKIEGSFTAGTVTSDEARIPIPIGTLASRSGVTASGNFSVGRLTTSDSTSGWYKHFDLLGKSGQSYLTVGYVGQYNATQTGLTSLPGSTAIQNLTQLSFWADFAIAGWGSSVAMSSDSGDGRVVVARAIGGSSATVSTGIPFHFTTTSYDSHSGFTRGTAGNANCFFYTAPISGYYRISCCVGINSTNGVSIFVNDVDNILMGQGTNGILTNYSGQVFLNAGQKVDIRPNSSSFTSVSNANNFFSIERISAGSQVIATNENVNCRYTHTTGATLNTSQTLLIYNALIFDSHSAYNTSTGLFTAPMNGKYLVTASMRTSNIGLGTTQGLYITIYKNGSFYKQFYIVGNGASNNWMNQITDTVNLLSGETVSIYVYTDSGTSPKTVDNVGAFNSLSIVRVGN